MTDQTQSGYPGFLDPRALGDQFLAQDFAMKQAMAGANHCHLVVVKEVAPGAVGPVGTVGVQILVNQIDGDGNATPHGVIHSLPYFRLQGGVNAVIIDPVVGDIGMAAFADRDISSVKANKAPSNPGSFRRFDFADGLYLGGFLNGAPTQYVQFLAAGAGINVVTPGTYRIQAGGKTWSFGTAGFTMSNAVIAETHIHDQPADSAGDGESPTLGPINP